MFENTSTSEITSVELCIIYLFVWQAVAAHTHHLGGARRSAYTSSFVLNYAEDLRRRLMAGVLRSTTTRGTAQHNRGIKRKPSITQIPAACRLFLPSFIIGTELKRTPNRDYNSPHALDTPRPAICDRDGFRRNRERLRFLHPWQNAQLRFLCVFVTNWKGFQVIPRVLEHRSPQRLVSPPRNRWSCRIRSCGNFPVLLSIRNPLVVGCSDSSCWRPTQTNPSDTQTTNSQRQSES
jgi:hypothetical protein